MPNLSPVPPAVISFLDAATGVRIQEIVGVGWQRGANIKWYSSTNVAEVMPHADLAAAGITTVEPRFQANQFIDIPGSADMGDDEISLDFWDGDRAIQDLFRLSGEGTLVRIFYWLPDAGPYLGEYFRGFMKRPKDAGGERFVIPVAEGFRSPDLKIPRRIIYPGCQAQFGGLVDPATGTPYFTTLAQMTEADNDCPYNRHIAGGDVGNMNGGVPFTSCPRQSRNDCKTRLNDDYSYLAFDVIVEQAPYISHGNRFVAVTQANESVLKIPLRVVAGYRFVDPITLLSFFTQPSDGGFLFTLWAVCEGEVEHILGCTINGNDPTAVPDGWKHLEVRNGARRQNPTGFSTTGLNYSGTAVVKMNVKVGNTKYTADQINGACYVKGKKIRVYNNPPYPETNYQKIWTDSRAWWLLETMANRRWGLGYAYAQFHLDDWIYLNAWCNEPVHSSYEDGEPTGGTVHPEPFPRTRFDAIIEGRDAREVIRDICMAGRFTTPFFTSGKLRVMPLQGESVASVPMFTDSYQYSTTPNIIFENGRSSLSYSQKPESELVNQIKLTFDNQTYNYAEQPIIYADEHAQLAAGRALGDSTIRVIEKAYSAFGVVRFPEAIRLARLLLDLGEFDSGGLKNNFSVKFKTWFPLGSAIGLHKYRVIRVRSAAIINFGTEFEYFRIMKLRRLNKLQLEVTAQAYPYQYYVNNENAPADRPKRALNIKNPGGVGFGNRLLNGKIVTIGEVPVVGTRAGEGASKTSVKVKVSFDPTDQRPVVQ